MLNNSKSLLPTDVYFDQNGIVKIQKKSADAKVESEPTIPASNDHLDLLKNRILINTPTSMTITSAIERLYPSYEIFPTTPIPKELHSLFLSFFNVFIEPESELKVDIHMSIIDEILEIVNSKEMFLGIFDDAREEVLELLYFGVFPRFLESNKNKTKVVLSSGNWFTRKYKYYMRKRRISKFS
ncbi:hypothetical protein AYI70_g2172 [Smittium culicis]|uniref:RGS domain-containing protein n=1 Tax=Smittium culicis TaxID=133412 RepID=A0A1R1Y9H8_9FUNG|nr:hypothetical protein AYI70_g2172 [Smittium culicis]